MVKNKAGCSRLRRWMPLLLAALLFAGLFARITMLARVSERGKRIASLEQALSRGEKEFSQKELLRSEMQDLRRVALRAGELGMTSPVEAQIRVLHIGEPDESEAG